MNEQQNQLQRREQEPNPYIQKRTCRTTRIPVLCSTGLQAGRITSTCVLIVSTTASKEGLRSCPLTRSAQSSANARSAFQQVSACRVRLASIMQQRHNGILHCA